MWVGGSVMLGAQVEYSAGSRRRETQALLKRCKDRNNDY